MGWQFETQVCEVIGFSLNLIYVGFLFRRENLDNLAFTVFADL
jgi:hypothetical protein